MASACYFICFVSLCFLCLARCVCVCVLGWGLYIHSKKAIKFILVLIALFPPKPTYLVIMCTLQFPSMFFNESHPSYSTSLIPHTPPVWAYGIFFYWWGVPIKVTSSSDYPWSVELIAPFLMDFCIFPCHLPTKTLLRHSPYLDSLCSHLKHSLSATWEMHALNNYMRSKIMQTCRKTFFPLCNEKKKSPWPAKLDYSGNTQYKILQSDEGRASLNTRGMMFQSYCHSFITFKSN